MPICSIGRISSHPSCMHPDDTQFRDMFRRMVFSKKEENKKVIVEMTLRPVLALQNNKI